MLRPSRPMMRPFISSLGRCRTETTDSAVCSVATRWMARVTILRARFSPSSRASRSMSRTISAASRLAWFSIAATSSGLGLVGGEPGDPLQDLAWRSSSTPVELGRARSSELLRSAELAGRAPRAWRLARRRAAARARRAGAPGARGRRGTLRSSSLSARISLLGLGARRSAAAPRPLASDLRDDLLRLALRPRYDIVGLTLGLSPARRGLRLLLGEGPLICRPPRRCGAATRSARLSSSRQEPQPPLLPT